MGLPWLGSGGSESSHACGRKDRTMSPDWPFLGLSGRTQSGIDQQVQGSKWKWMEDGAELSSKVPDSDWPFSFSFVWGRRRGRTTMTVRGLLRRRAGRGQGWEKICKKSRCHDPFRSIRSRITNYTHLQYIHLVKQSKQ